MSRRASPLALTALALAAAIWAPAAGAAGAPQLGSLWTAGVGTAAAGLRAEVSPNGLQTTYHFSYLSAAAYDANLAAGADGFAGALKAPIGVDPGIGSGTTALTVAQSLAALTPDTAYRYRVQAANGAGTVTGPTRTFRTEPFADGTTMLDSRAWEMVSPPEKGGDQVQGFGGSFGGGILEAAAAGGAFTYSSTASFGADAAGAPPVSQYVARRGAAGWSNADVSPATVSGAYGAGPDGAPYRLFSEDLSRALMLEGLRCGEGEACPRPFSMRDGAGALLATSPAAPDLRLAGASPDAAHAVLSSCAALTADATEAPLGGGCDPGQPNLYEWSGAGLTLLNLLPAAAQGTPGAALAAPLGAISADGARVYWTLGGDLYLREGSATKQVDAGQGGGGLFQAASVSGAVAFFTRDLAPGNAHLFRYLAASGTATDLTPSGGVVGVLGTSADGAYVYYLTAAGLFLRHGEAAPVKVADGADASNYPPATGTARVTPDGMRLAFLSRASLTGYDNRNATSGVPETEVFLYDAAATSLSCVSCNPTDERPLGPSSMRGAIANGTTLNRKPRNLLDDGSRLFFDSADALAIQDTAGQADAYEWEANGAGSCRRQGGCLALLSRGRNSAGASFLDASASGTDAFFLTADSLVGSDGGFADVYDGREGGGFPEPLRPIECAGDACQPLPPEPEDPEPGTLVPGPGNPPLASSRPRRCRKGFVRRHRRCMRKHRAAKRHTSRRRGR